MGFEPDQCLSQVESVNKFKDQMRSTLEEAKAVLAKSKEDMTRYYNQRRTKAPKYKPRDRVYLDASDICTTHPSKSYLTSTKAPSWLKDAWAIMHTAFTYLHQ